MKTHKTYKYVKTSTPLTYDIAEVKAEGNMLGYEMFVAKHGNTYKVYDKNTGYSLSNNTYKTIKNSIESEMLYLLGRAGNDKKTLKSMFSRAYTIAKERGTSTTLNN